MQTLAMASDLVFDGIIMLDKERPFSGKSEERVEKFSQLI
jgi:hypothetical protein